MAKLIRRILAVGGNFKMPRDIQSELSILFNQRRISFTLSAPVVDANSLFLTTRYASENGLNMFSMKLIASFSVISFPLVSEKPHYRTHPEELSLL